MMVPALERLELESELARIELIIMNWHIAHYAGVRPSLIEAVRMVNERLSEYDAKLYTVAYMISEYHRQCVAYSRPDVGKVARKILMISQGVD